MEKDDTQYRLITSDYVSVGDFEGHPMLKVEPEGLRLLAAEAFHDVAFFLRPAHLKQVAAILDDPEASDNDKSVALTMLRNAEVASAGILPFCQDTGTATIVGKKGQQVWTGCDDCEQLSHGVYDAYTQNNLRYSQTVALDMYTEKNTGTNLPAQIDLEAVEGMKYSFLFVAKGGGSANKTYLYQETKALLNPATLKKFLVEKMSTLGTAACPPYHIAFVIGGTSAEKCLKTVKMASTKYYDNLPTTGNEYGRAFRDLELEKELHEEACKLGLGAQFGGKYLAHDVRVIRLPRHGASCPVGLGVSCSADRNAKAKITPEGIFIEQLETNPGQYIPEALRMTSSEAVSIDLNRPMKEVLAELGKYPVPPRLSLNGPRQAEGTPGKGRRAASVHEGSPRVLRRPGENPGRLPLRFLRPHDRRPHGLLRGPVPGKRRLHDHDCQGQPKPAGNRCLPETRRFLPGLHRRPRRHPGQEQHQESGTAGIPGTGHGSHLEN